MTSFCILLTFYLCSSLLAQSVSSNDCKQINSSQFSWSSTYLSSVLHFIVNSDSITIITDCLIERDVRIGFYSTIAVSIFNPFDTINSKRFGESKELFVIDLPEMEVANATKIIYKKFLNERVSKWQPTIIILWRGLISSIQQMTLLRRHFSNQMLHLDSHVFVVFFETSSFPLMSSTPTEIAVWEMYAIKTKPVFSLVAHLSLNDQLMNGSSEQNISLESISKRRSNFQLENFTAAVKYDQDIIEWTGLETNEDATYMLSMTDDLVAVIYWDLKMLMNFSAKVIAGDTIYIHRNGTASGKSASLLNSGEADISLNHASFSPGRANSFSFLQPTYHSLIHVFFKQPPANSIRDIVIAAFKKELWITLIGVWAILLISLQVRLLLLPKNSLSTHSSLESSAASTQDYRFAKESVLWSVAIVCQKSWYLSPRSTTLRMKVIVGSFVSLISYTAYSASIVSSLAVNKIPVKTFTDLISFNFIFTVHEKSEPFQAILKGLLQSFDLNQEVVTTSTVTEISHLITDSSLHTSRNAFLSAADMFYRTAESLNYSDIFICNHISSIPAGPTLHKSGTLVPKGSHYKEVLNHMLIYLKERGMLLRYIDRYNSKYVFYCVNKDSESRVEPAVFNDVFTIMLVLFVGIPLAFVVLATEFMYIFVN